jgi:DNA-binding NarL/FixJ family response regulator
MAAFLVVDDNSLIRRALSRVLEPYGLCRTSPSLEDAEYWIEAAESRRASPWDGFVIDILLEDGSGLDLLERVRRSHATTPAVIISGELNRAAVNRAATLNARFLCKPCGTTELAPFVSDVLYRSTGDRLYAAAERARHRWGLTPTETKMLEATLRGRSRDEYMKETGITPNTFKTLVRHILEKSEFDSLARLSVDLLAEG